MTALSTQMLIVGVLLVSSTFCGQSIADTTTTNDNSVTVLPEVTQYLSFGSAPVSGEVLAAYRGGAEVGVVNDNRLNGVVGGNQAYNLSTGSNLVTDGSFAGSSGLATVIQNSGNNVLIQNSTIVNMQLK